MNKKFLSLFLSILIFISIPFPANAASNIKIWVNGNYITSDVAPIVENQRTLVPIRVISEGLGLRVQWVQEEEKIIISQYSEIDNGNSIMLKLNDKNIYDSEEGPFPQMEVAPKVVNNRTLVPLRAISNMFDLKVTRDQDNYTVAIGEGYRAPTKSYNKIPLVSNNNSNNSSNNGGEDGVFHNPSDPAYLYANNRLIGHTGSKIYHAPGQKSYKKVSVENAVYFNSDSEAVAAGYRKAKR